MTPAPAHAPATDPWPSAARGWWAVAVLTLAYIVSFVDRTIISLLIEPIKADLSLSDTQIALVQGLAFGIFYTVMGIPLGWLADRVSRRGLIAAGAAVWSLMTAWCGLAQSFGQLFVARLGVGAGEATLSPSALSIISDCFPRERRGLPIGVYTGAAACGAGIALILGGLVVEMVSTSDRLLLPLVGEVARWQAAFIIVGLGGAIVVPLMATVIEPRRRNESAAHAHSSSLVAFIRQHPAFMLRHYGAVGLYCIVIYGILSWVPAFFMRTYGWTAAQVGLSYGLVLLVFGGAGNILGGWIASVLVRRGMRDAAIVVTGGGMLLAAVPLALAGLAGAPALALVWFAPGLLLMTLPGGTAIQVIQEAVPNQLRGQASALYYLVAGVAGLTLGPLSVALLTDYVFEDPGQIGPAIAIVAGAVAPLAGALSLFARRPFRELAADLARDPAALAR